MATHSVTIQKNPVLETSQDYLALRRMGIGFIEASGSRWWTDYNSHDPGITILEALCYAITDLGYRTEWNIEDLLASPPAEAGENMKQAFFTARDILTVSPLTINDYRRLLVDMDHVGNAWIYPRSGSCETAFHANYEHGKLLFAPSRNAAFSIPVSPRGTYDIFLGLENDPLLGDLNDRKIGYGFFVEAGRRRHAVTMEFRFPEWNTPDWGNAADYVDEKGNLAEAISSVEIRPSLQKIGMPDTLPASEITRRWSQWHRVFFASMTITFEKGVVSKNRAVSSIELQNVPFRLFGENDAKKAFSVGMLEKWDFRELAGLFIRKTARIEQALKSVSMKLGNYRNLCEDFCCIKPVRIQDVAVCADIEVNADADIELVLAHVLFRIERLFNPEIRFFTLQEMLADGVTVEEIFEGPRLDHGFIRTTDLEQSVLASQLRTSDIINELMEIEGIIAINNLMLTRYDQDGFPESGVADGGEGKHKDKISAEWSLEIDDDSQPRLSITLSKFIFHKNGLPFIPRSSEVIDTLNQLRGEVERLKICSPGVEELDLPVPEGVYRQPDGFTPVQYLFPLAYGIGAEGVHSPATVNRIAQARQLKAYLMVFEQMLANAFSQLANLRKIFSLDETLKQSYFVRNLRDEKLISGVSDVIDSSLTESVLELLVENEPDRTERRNRFLDHLLARFGEQFAEYTLLLSNHKGSQVASDDLIESKCSFLKAYPKISCNRARSINYRQIPMKKDPRTSLRQRIALLLGLEADMESEIIIVEHLLLRPKFPGDALMAVCLGKQGPNEAETDPYSFQCTVIMPGWAPPFDTDIELRRFAERTIQMELPAHLLCRICWASNLAFGDERKAELEHKLASLLYEEGRNAGNARPGRSSAEKGAKKIYAAAQAASAGFLQKKTMDEPANAHVASDKAGRMWLEKTPPYVTLYGGVRNYDIIGNRISSLLSMHFSRIARKNRWELHRRFKEAWNHWRELNAGFDWCMEQVRTKIDAAIQTTIGLPGPRAAAEMLAVEFAACFSQEMKNNVMNGTVISLDGSPAEVRRIFMITLKQTMIPLKQNGVTTAELDNLRNRFAEIYSGYIEVTMALWNVLLLLPELSSSYPSATLHDCDDGNDRNPVRLGSTSLGENVMREA